MIATFILSFSSVGSEVVNKWFEQKWERETDNSLLSTCGLHWYLHTWWHETQPSVFCGSDPTTSWSISGATEPEVIMTAKPLPLPTKAWSLQLYSTNLSHYCYLTTRLLELQVVTSQESFTEPWNNNLTATLVFVNAFEMCPPLVWCKESSQYPWHPPFNLFISCCHDIS